MYCCYCGKSIPDDAKFCGYCGKSTPTDFKKSDSVEEKPAPAPAAPKNTGFAPAAPECKNPPKPASSGYRLTQYGSAARPVSYTKTEQVKMTYQQVFNYNWRRFVSSPMVIITVIFFCILTVYNISAAQDSFEMIYDMLDELRMDDLASAMLSLQFLSFLPSILTCLGMILILADGFRSKTMLVSSVGLHIIRTTMIVMVSIGGVLLTVVMLSVLELASKAGGSSEGMSAFVLGMILGIGFAIFYISSVFTVMNNALYGIRNGSTDNSKVIVVAVFQFISAGVLVLNVLVGEELDFATVLQMVSTICLGVVLVMYNGMLDTTYYMQIKANNP